MFFNNDCSITCLNKITIGANCLFGENVKLYDHNHKFRNENVKISEQGYTLGEIEDVVLLKNAEIGTML